MPFALALAAAALFGSATPGSKALLGDLSPFQLAGLLYLGAALAIAPLALRRGGLRLPGRGDQPNRVRLAGAVIAGGLAGPVLLLFGLRLAGAASVSLWLSFELVATALLGALFFREPLGRAGWVAVACAVAGAAVLAAPSGDAGTVACALVLAACLCWGLDNQLTALIDGITPAESTFWKGLVAGGTNLALGLALEPFSAPAPALACLGALAIGALSYGASIVLYISAAQRLGATRAQIAFSSAPLFGLALSVSWLGERLGIMHAASLTLFALAIGLLMLERHAHRHAHEAMRHEHSHRHDDEHHTHAHPGLPAATVHSHEHEHAPLVHAHPHWPDLHHRHGHHATERHN